VQPMHPRMGAATVCDSWRMQAVRRRRPDCGAVHPCSLCEHEFHQAALFPQRASRRRPGGRPELCSLQHRHLSISTRTSRVIAGQQHSVGQNSDPTSRFTTGQQHPVGQHSDPRQQSTKCKPTGPTSQQQRLCPASGAGRAGSAGTSAVQGLPGRPPEAFRHLPASELVCV
jgi:hypothetical protein